MTVYDIITDRIVSLLESGTVPWRKPWNTQAGCPKNLVSKREYRGINVFLLHCLGYELPYFLTYRQAKKRGGHVRQGERGCPVVFWKCDWRPKPADGDDEERAGATVPLLRYYTVFNVAQCEGIEYPLPSRVEREHTPVTAAENIVQGMPHAPHVEHGSRQACYVPSLDSVRMPRPEVFESGEAYYATLFHELTHSTGHSSRLDRKVDTVLAPFDSTDYSREELVAEMGAAFLCAEAGIADARIDQSAAYIEGWLRRLRSDKRLVVVAAAQAQKAADFILARVQPWSGQRVTPVAWRWATCVLALTSRSVRE